MHITRTARSVALAAATATIAGMTADVNAVPPYMVVDLSNVNQPMEKAVRAEGISSNGLHVAGWTQQLNASNQVIGNRVWSSAPAGPPSVLQSTAGRNFHFARAVNDSGVVAGISATTLFFSSPLPIFWQNGVPTQLPLPAGESIGRLTDLNNSNVAVGSVNGGSLERATRFTLGGAEILGNFSDGGALVNANGINDAGRIVGRGIDPANAAVNRGFYLDPAGTPQDIPSFAGTNGEIPNDVNSSGAVVGSAMLNQGSGLPFYWTEAGGMIQIPLPSSGNGIADGLNDDGWVVGRDLNAVVGGNPTGTGFLWDGTQTFHLNDLIGAQASDWNLQAPFAISNDGIIVGQGFFGGGTGDVRAWAMIPIPEPATGALMTVGMLPLLRRRRNGSA